MPLRYIILLTFFLAKAQKNGPSSFGEATFYMNLSVGIIGLRFSEEQVAVGNAIVLGYTYS